MDSKKKSHWNQQRGHTAKKRAIRTNNFDIIDKGKTAQTQKTKDKPHNCSFYNDAMAA